MFDSKNFLLRKIFQLAVGELFHSVTPSLGHFLLDVCNPGGEMGGETPISKIMSVGILVVKFKFKY